MKNQITQRDYELISAYLDNQLSSKERAYLDARLRALPELRSELHEISKTRRMVREMPKLRAPHNYFISAKSVNVPATRLPNRMAPAMGIASAIATILLALVIFGENLLTSTAPLAMAPAPVTTEVTMALPEAQRSAESAPLPTEAAPLIMMEAPKFASPTETIIVMPSAPPGSATPTTIYLNAYPPTVTPVINISIYGADTASPTITISGQGFGGLQGFPTNETPTPTPTLTPSPTPTETATPTASPTPTPTETAIPTLSNAPSMDTGLSANEPPSAASEASGTAPVETQVSERSQATQNIDLVKYILLAVKISLAGIAILAGLFALILRFR